MSSSIEYVWLDGYTPTPLLRSKVKVVNNSSLILDDVPEWGFDGSSTKQADGGSSDCLLKPVKLYKAPAAFGVDYLVMCEVLNPDGSPHESNTRQWVHDHSEEWWFGFEQEYVLMKGSRPFGWPEGNAYPRPQGEFYCGVGADNVTGRDIVEEHMNACLEAGISITGTNAEVMLGQWEYQCFAKGAHNAADDLWMSRYLLNRITERHGVYIDTSPKPVRGDWNGNGMHTNFSNTEMRDVGGEDLIGDICVAMGRKHEKHIEVYGAENEHRLTGLHETQHIDEFSYGVSDRGASIRIPVATVNNDWKGYLEDRRPAGNADPYRVVTRIIQTLITAYRSE